MRLLASLPHNAELTELRSAALSGTPVSIGPRRTASPHEYYRYPARFSPSLAAAAIAAFSAPGDLVSDYFLGGGTTLVEARLAGRIGFGSDLNSLATFVSKVKTRLYTNHELDAVKLWSVRAATAQTDFVSWPADEQSVSYFRNFSDPALAEQRQVLLAALAALSEVPSGKARDFARCVLLRTAQWGMDMRSVIPTEDDLRTAITDNATSMVDAARIFTQKYREADRQTVGSGLPRSLVLHQGLPGVSGHASVTRYSAPRLVLTSPPYPGVYVNYHRWKVRGRLETPLPYFIAGQSDGHGLAHYTMAARSDRTQVKYFKQLQAAYTDVARLCDPNTWLVQVVGFNNLDDQLPRYLSTMNRAGFDEVLFGELSTSTDRRLWRDVPGRRWWARAGDRSEVVQHTAREVILFHTLSR